MSEQKDPRGCLVIGLAVFAVIFAYAGTNAVLTRSVTFTDDDGYETGSLEGYEAQRFGFGIAGAGVYLAIGSALAWIWPKKGGAWGKRHQTLNVLGILCVFGILILSCPPWLFWTDRLCGVVWCFTGMLVCIFIAGWRFKSRWAGNMGCGAAAAAVAAVIIGGRTGWLGLVICLMTAAASSLHWTLLVPSLREKMISPK